MEPLLPQELYCADCGSVVCQSFVNIQSPPVVYCTNCAAAIVYLQNYLSDKAFYNPEILVTAGWEQSNFGSKNFNAVHHYTNDEKGFWKIVYNPSK